jgi:hypothetical protein
MQNLVRRVAYFIVLLTTASTGVAAAECAWILWQENSLLTFGQHGGHSKWWEIVGSYTASDACTQAQLRVWEALATRCDGGKCPGVQEVKKVSPSLVILDFKPDEAGYPGSSTSRLICLPDTIDPREKPPPALREQSRPTSKGRK